MTSMAEVGLRIILTQIISKTSQSSKNILVKSTLVSTQTSKTSSPPPSCMTRFRIGKADCFLKSCHLCRKKLSPDKDIYMYRGDQGFCSVECRERQIVIEEMEKMEMMVRTSSASSSSSSSSTHWRILLRHS